ncbi:MAG: bifunctional nuclease family protein [Cyanobacteria bacterium NC_groundwater_1444_Ag_S-0.65um_54_12]|nr:bifunctional nuclease family protein [Cyanobacteria bacterium NC_groundwater_1444_Ag_S-0.65um_54_12]
MVEVKVSGVILEPQSRSPIVVLKDEEERRALLIWVGEPEANAILLGMEKIPTPRPLTHDLFFNTLKTLEAELGEIRISDMKNNTFFAELKLAWGGKEVIIDARPSDAIALALRAKAPIFVAEEIMANSAIPINNTREDSDSEEFRKFIQNVKPSDFNRLGG